MATHSPPPPPPPPAAAASCPRTTTTMSISASTSADGSAASAPPPRDLSHRFSHVTRARHANLIKQFYKYLLIPGIGNLAAGTPNPAYFPIDTLGAQVAAPARWRRRSSESGAHDDDDDDDDGDKNGDGGDHGGGSDNIPDQNATCHLSIPHDSTITDRLHKIDLASALSYGTAEGYPPLYSFLRQFTRAHLHPTVPYRGGPEIVLSSGNTDGIAKVVEAFTNVWVDGRDDVREREALLCEEFAYMPAVQTVSTRGLQVVPIGMDEQGMLAEGPRGLRERLEDWDLAMGKRPHLLYTVTIGQNPTSGVLGVQRKKELYAICSQYDIIILEDDPYWHLQYPSSRHRQAQARHEARPQEETSTPVKTSGFAFLDSLVPSYLSVDVDGRVVRVDTFSKTIAPGCRLGWITAQPAIIERLLRITESATQQPSGFVQSLVAELIMGPQARTEEFSRAQRKDQHFDGWRMDGWVRWLEGLRGNYERNMVTMCEEMESGRWALKQGTPTNDLDREWTAITRTPMYTFDWPRGGMFVWVEMLFDNHALRDAVSPSRLSTALFIFLTTPAYLVLIWPGTIFAADPAIAADRGWRYFRMCFAAMDTALIRQTSRRFVKGVRAFWKIKDAREIDRIIDSNPPGLARVGDGQADLAMQGLMGC